MVDKSNPTNQFHPYTPAEATPHSEQPAPTGLKAVLGRARIDPDNLGALGDKLKNVDVQQSIGKARDFARSKPGIALGGLALAAIGAGLMWRRS